jgi:hypothetical protein
MCFGPVYGLRSESAFFLLYLLGAGLTDPKPVRGLWVERAEKHGQVRPARTGQGANGFQPVVGLVEQREAEPAVLKDAVGKPLRDLIRAFSWRVKKRTMSVIQDRASGTRRVSVSTRFRAGASTDIWWARATRGGSKKVNLPAPPAMGAGVLSRCRPE